MYVVQVTIEDKCGKNGNRVLIYGPYKTEEKADDVRLKLGEKALSAPGQLDVKIAVIPLVKSGMDYEIEQMAKV